ncbi:MAG: hypothetical protein GF331_18250 [Chitinivibrionales bacterium]|nr:hypothetical protein [Chitinivibrionales bacterium]
MRDQSQTVYRVIDANLNRLREALRVVEEYVRFSLEDCALSVRLKTMRHELRRIEEAAGRERLLAGRNTAGDPFASENRPEERRREGLHAIVWANLKRAQEAARVLEEYTKITDMAAAADIAKRLRFDAYAIEKQLAEQLDNGEEEKR